MVISVTSSVYWDLPKDISHHFELSLNQKKPKTILHARDMSKEAGVLGVVAGSGQSRGSQEDKVNGRFQYFSFSLFSK